jgi:hypothetical protein
MSGPPGTEITLTDHLLDLANGLQAQVLPLEVDARWNVVQTSWGLAAIILRAGCSKRPTSMAQETKTFRLCQSRYLVAGAWASSGRSSTSRKGGCP